MAKLLLLLLGALEQVQQPQIRFPRALMMMKMMIFVMKMTMMMNPQVVLLLVNLAQQHSLSSELPPKAELSAREPLEVELLEVAPVPIVGLWW